MHHVPGGRDHGEEAAYPPGHCPGQAPDADHIDFIEAQLGNRYDPVTCGESYLISCLYNAPMDCMVNTRRAL